MSVVMLNIIKLSVAMMSVTILSLFAERHFLSLFSGVIMLSVVMPNVFVLVVVAPLQNWKTNAFKRVFLVLFVHLIKKIPILLQN
jgi:hypothetical protein